MVSLEEAQKYLLDNSRKMDTEIINICDSHKRVLAEDIHAPFDNPPFNKLYSIVYLVSIIGG